MLPCVDSGGPEGGIPILPCDIDCSEWWNECREPFNQYLTTVLHGDWTQSKNVLCLNGSFTAANGTVNALGLPDAFGGRNIDGSPFYPQGYTGVLRYPIGDSQYYFANGSSITTQCYHPTRPANALTITVNVTCVAPLGTGVDANGNQACILPCPFPLFSADEVASAQLAYIVPGCLGLFFCVLVLLDSLWVIFEHTGGLNLRRVRKYFLWSSGTNSSTADDSAITSGNNSEQRRRPIQAMTLYLLVGSLLGIVYFCLGPLPSIIKGANVSCGSTTTGFPFVNIASGQADMSDVTCRAQRYSPFILQLVFNLILFTIVKVIQVISDWYKAHSSRSKLGLSILLHFYCWAVPIIFLIIASALDGLSTDLNTGFEQILRQASICLFRFHDPSVEIVLIYVPFIVTGVLVSGLSLLVLKSILSVRNKVAGTAKAKNEETDLAMNLLILRLAGLGLGTFVVLIVLMVTTSVFESEVNQFVPEWVAWFECIDTTYECNLDSCDSFLAKANANRPTAALMATQLASTSCITLIFGVFFTAQSAARLIKEYRNGQLGKKWRALVLGSHTNSSVHNSGVKERRVAGSEMPLSNTLSNNSFTSRVETMAAYQES